MAFSWFKLDASMRQHPKTLALQRALGDRGGWRWPVALWMWCASSCPSGFVSHGRGADVRTDGAGRAGDLIEDAVGWDGKAGVLASALLDCGFLDPTDDGLQVHNWADNNAAHADRRKKDAERKRLARAAAKASRADSAESVSTPASVGQSADVRADGARTSDGIRALEERERREEGEKKEKQGAAPAEAVPVPRPSDSDQSALALDAAVGKRAPVALAALQTAWNDMAATSGLPAWRETPKARAASARLRLSERTLDGPGGWLAVIARIGASSFCRGQNDRGWRADPDFLLRPDTATKALEGKYDDAPSAPARRRFGDTALAVAPPEAHAITPEDLATLAAMGDAPIDLMSLPPPPPSAR